MKLYHYTDTEGKNAIENSGYIKKSQRSAHRDDAQYGTGVYLTSLGPETLTSRLLKNNYDGNRTPRHMLARTEWYFEFDTSENELDGVEEVGSDRDIWILRGTDLPIYRQAGQRKV